MFNSMASNFCHMIKPRTLFLILFLSSVTFSVFAKPGKYDELLQKSSGWNSTKIINTADNYKARWTKQWYCT